mgnify:CR=1 FL=1
MSTTKYLRALSAGTITGFAFCLALAVSGCEKKEKVLDVETPRGELEVERSTENGDVDVEVNRE